MEPPWPSGKSIQLFRSALRKMRLPSIATTPNSFPIESFTWCTPCGTLKFVILEERFMRNTNPKQFRAELKDYLDLAAKEPIRIQRRSGENYILLKEDMYQSL